MIANKNYKALNSHIFLLFFFIIYINMNFFDMVFYQSFNFILYKAIVLLILFCLLIFFFIHKILINKKINRLFLYSIIFVLYPILLSILIYKNTDLKSIIYYFKYLFIPFLAYFFYYITSKIWNKQLIIKISIIILIFQIPFIIMYCFDYDSLKYLGIKKFNTEVLGLQGSKYILNGFLNNSFRMLSNGKLVFRFIGSSLSSLDSGYLLAFILLVLFILKNEIKNIHLKGISYILVGIFITILFVLNPSRGATLSLFISLLFYFILQKVKQDYWNKLFFLVFFSFIIIVILYIFSSEIKHNSFYRHALDIFFYPQILYHYPLGYGIKSENFMIFDTTNKLVNIFGNKGTESGLFYILYSTGIIGLLFFIYITNKIINFSKKNYNIEAVTIYSYIIFSMFFHKPVFSFMPGFIIMVFFFVILFKNHARRI